MARQRRPSGPAGSYPGIPGTLRDLTAQGPPTKGSKAPSPAMEGVETGTLQATCGRSAGQHELKYIRSRPEGARGVLSSRALPFCTLLSELVSELLSALIFFTLHSFSALLRALLAQLRGFCAA